MIDKITNIIKYCVGCHACANICPKSCIYMESNEGGFLYPKVDYDLCMECNRCIEVCPINNKAEIDNKPIAFSCINNDEKIRIDSSSGGIFTLIAEKVLSEGGVVFGAVFDDDFQVEHQYVEKKEELWKLRGSKYVQSKIGDSYKQAKKFLDNKKKVLFTGTPCQNAGLKSYLGGFYDDLLTIDLICHGVPSPLVWKKYIEFREKEAGSPVKRIAFRKKNEGWKRFSVSFLFKDNTEYLGNLHNDLYIRAFLKNVCLRPSCYNCMFKGLNRHSDITLADFWGIQNVLPEMDNDKGTSLVFVNSRTGKDLFNGIKDRMLYQEVDINEAVKYNSSAIKSAMPNSNRDNFFKDLKYTSFDKLVKRYCTDQFIIRVKKIIILAFKKIVTKFGFMGK